MMINTLHMSIRFLLELATIGLIIASGLHGNSWVKLGTLVILIILVFFWSRYMAPLSLYRFKSWQRLFAEIVIFGGTALFSYFYLSAGVALPYASIALIDTIFEHLLPQPFHLN